MTATLSAIKAAYLDRVASGLGDLSEDDREEVLQDLRAHLAELDERQVDTVLGSPEGFVAEFRASAGLNQPQSRFARWSIASVRSRMARFEQRLADATRWRRIQPVWVWTRGWFLVSTIAVLSGGITFRHFPVPIIEGSTAIGLALVLAATLISLWLDQRKTAAREVGSFLYSAIVVILLGVSLLSARDLARTYPFEEEIYFDRMVGPDGQTITNIYAYDLDGNQVEVLLFDQEGRPLVNFPSWVYEEAELSPQQGPVHFEEGVVEFARDEFGRIIPNLYPLVLYRYGEYGTRLEPVPPPALGFPGSDEINGTDGSSIVTTTTPGPLD